MSFGSGLTAINEFRKHIDYILDEIFVFSAEQTFVLKLLPRTKNMTG